jgi:hypothetical protein
MSRPSIDCLLFIYVYGFLTWDGDGGAEGVVLNRLSSGRRVPQILNTIKGREEGCGLGSRPSRLSPFYVCLWFPHPGMRGM